MQITPGFRKDLKKNTTKVAIMHCFVLIKLSEHEKFTCAVVRLFFYIFKCICVCNDVAHIN